jgi:multiple sugar transport system ATP-binding protein
LSEIELIDVSKKFGAVSVIDNFSLNIESNELLVFLGPSGCGKSTLLRMIAGLETVDAGQILVDGERVDHLPPGKRGVAMVFQNYALYPHMKVRDNMAFGLENIKMSKSDIDRRIADAATILEITELLDRKPAQLSGGQRQRVAIGRAIVKDPKVFLFDEPLSNLDAALRVRTRVELSELHNRMEATMIYVTHDQIEAMTLADRIVVLNDRKIEQIGTPMEIYSKPTSQFVAAFVGSPAMNFAPVSLKGSAKNKLSITLPDGSSFESTIDISEAGDPGNLTLGIRADALKVVAADKGTTNGRVQVVEQLGERTLVYVAMDDGTVFVAHDISESTVRAGDTVGLEFDGAGAHIFDESGKAYHAT